MGSKKIALFLLGEKGYSVLENLSQSNLTSCIEMVIVGKDKNIANDFSKEIAETCNKRIIPIQGRHEDLTLVKSELWVAIGWRWMIKANRCAKLIVLHDSLLPKYRGFAPLVNQLINGEKKLGVTALIANEEFDRGPILLQEEITVSYPLKIQQAIALIAPLYRNIVKEVVSSYIAEGKLIEREQNEGDATYSLWRDDNDYEIDWNCSSKRIKRFIDAVGYPYKGAKTVIDGEEIIIKEAETVEDVKIENRNPGKVLFMSIDKPIVVCGTGLLKITEAEFLSKKQSVFPLKRYRSRFGRQRSQ